MQACSNERSEIAVTRWGSLRTLRLSCRIGGTRETEWVMCVNVPATFQKATMGHAKA